MKTLAEREKHFRQGLKELLNKHQAEIEITLNSESGTPLLRVTMAAIYDDADSGDLIADYCEFVI